MPRRLCRSFFYSCFTLIWTLIYSSTYAAEVAVPDVEQSQNGIQFACTGIAEARDDPKWDQYPLKVVFASKNGQFIGRVRVTLQSEAGQPLVDVFCLTPWFVARLPEGKYALSAVATNGVEKTATITVSQANQKTQHLHFPDGNY